jgi:hypothetical protein
MIWDKEKNIILRIKVKKINYLKLTCKLIKLIDITYKVKLIKK